MFHEESAKPGPLAASLRDFHWHISCYLYRLNAMTLFTATLDGISARDRIALTRRSSAMNSDIMSGNWKQLKGKLKEQWGKLTDDDLTVIEGKRDQLVGRLQERYGYTLEKAQKEADEFTSHVV